MIKTFPTSILFVFLMTLVVPTQTAHACSCIPPEPPVVSMEKSDAVFAGRVTNIVPPANMTTTLDENKITFDVSTSWKGVDRNPVQIFSAVSSASCGYEFEEGKEYLVYAYESEGRLSTGLCTRTALLADASEDLAALGAGETVSPDGANEEVAGRTNLAIPIAALLSVAAIAYYFFNKSRKKTTLI